MSRRVAALYVDPKGPYQQLERVDCWGVDQDARKYNGPHPVVAHPPCGPWGKLRHMYRGNEHDCAPIAVTQVRVFGGVLEHPAHSLLWPECNLPQPGFFDLLGGFCVEVTQVSWGHVARKRTWLYMLGVSRDLVLRTMRTGGEPTHWVSGGGTGKGRTPVGIKVCSALQRRLTPPAFAAWLVQIARSV